MSECLIYARYSPKPSSKKDPESIETQVAICKEWAAKNGHTVLAVYADRHKTGGMEKDETDPSSVDRPELWRCLQDLKPGQIVLVWRMDRIGRDVYFNTFVERSILRRKADLISATEGSPLASLTDEERLTRDIVMAVGAHERRAIARRTRDSMRSLMQEGRRVGGTPPFGWMSDPKDPRRLTPNPREQEAIERTRVLRLMGNSLVQIQRMLREEGFTGRAGGPISRTTLHSIVRGTNYKGSPLPDVRTIRKRRPRTRMSD